MAEKEYIEREAAKKIFENRMQDNDVMCPVIKVLDALLIIEQQPTADVQEVVRCKECLWRGTEECSMYYRCNCGEQHTWETDNDFCSYGAKMDKE